MRRLVALALAAVGCGGGEATSADASLPVPDAAPLRLVGAAHRELDVLFVIDNSGNMLAAQPAFVSGLPSLFGAIADVDGAQPSLHLGVVSSNVGAGGNAWTGCAGKGDDGRLQNVARGACTPPSGYYISDIPNPDGTRTRNYAGDLAATLACIAELGTDGCGFEQHLEAMRRALDGSNPQNQGFVRDGALLAVVVLASEDDCSASDTAVFDATQPFSGPLGPSTFRCTEYGVVCDDAPLPRAPGEYKRCAPRVPSDYIADPAQYVQFLRDVKGGDESLLLAGVIVGPVTPFVVTDEDGSLHVASNCDAEDQTGDPGVRLSWFADQLGGLTRSICGTDLSAALGDLGAHFAARMGTSCLWEAPVDPSECVARRGGTPVYSPPEELPLDVVADDRCPSGARAEVPASRWQVWCP